MHSFFKQPHFFSCRIHCCSQTISAVPSSQSVSRSVRVELGKALDPQNHFSIELSNMISLPFSIFQPCGTEWQQPLVRVPILVNQQVCNQLCWLNGRLFGGVARSLVASDCCCRCICLCRVRFFVVTYRMHDLFGQEFPCAAPCRARLVSHSACYCVPRSRVWNSKRRVVTLVPACYGCEPL